MSWVPDPAVRPANSTSTGPLCNGFYQTILWEDQLGAIKLTNETTIDGDVATCRLVIASMSIAVIVSIISLFIVLLVSLGYVYDFMANNSKLYVLVC